MLGNIALYAHFPWCVKKCPYCDFNSHPIPNSVNWHGYTEALLQDWAGQFESLKRISAQPSEDEPAFRVATIFLGGGTPSLFEAQHLARLMHSIPLDPGAEVTMEANPGTTEYTDFATYHAAGINRLSLGAQSFNNTSLEKLGRIHSTQETVSAFENARLGGFDNINIDLMWGLPEQSVDMALQDLRQAISLLPEHISWYQLAIEAKTEFAVRTPLLPKDRVLADIEYCGLNLLRDAGYKRYEVSAFAQPGRKCLHNINYWQFGDYIGIGAGAHGKFTAASGQICRYSKPHQPRVYLQNPKAITREPVGYDQITVEFMMNTLRLLNGVSFNQFSNATGFAWDAIAAKWQKLVDQGLVRSDRCATTPMGMRYLDSVVAEFIH